MYVYNRIDLMMPWRHIL